MIRVSPVLILILWCIGSSAQVPCNNWLGVPSEPSYVRVGDLDVPGNQITVEALIIRTTPWSGGPLYAGDIVSKHQDPVNVNYLLRPNHAEITTTNGYFRTPDICDIDLNKTYHVAMVYDGSQLKFYRNGYLMSKVAVSGNLFQNDFETRIGFYQLQMYHTNFIGYINEVRIWNVARTQSQLQAYMNSSLPSPTTQAGLLAYYTFDNLLNKQGNATWNASLGGSATINQTNPVCPAFVADSCCAILSGTIAGNNICPGSAGMLTYTASAGQGPFTLTYTDGTNIFTQNNVQSGVPFTVSPNPTTSTTYSLMSIDDASPCPATPISSNAARASITVLSNSIMPDSIHADNSIFCVGTNTQLSVKGGSLGSGAEWKWYSNNCSGSQIGSGNSITATPLVNTSYFVRAEGTCNSTSCVSIPIAVNAKPNLIFDSIPPICENDGNIQLNEAREISGLAGAGQYTGKGVSSSGLFSPAMAGSGKYQLTYTFISSAGCANSSSRNIVVNPTPTANAGKDLIACEDIPVQLHATGGKDYEWSPVSGLSDPKIANPILKTNVGQTYSVKVTDANGCVANDSMTVAVSVNDKEIFKLPNAFSPNADGKNDCFGMRKWGSVEIKEFSVFNRWGQKIFSTKNPSDCWDGTFNGIKQDSGGYVYMIKVNTACGEIFLKGVVTLIR